MRLCGRVSSWCAPIAPLMKSFVVIPNSRTTSRSPRCVVIKSAVKLSRQRDVCDAHAAEDRLGEIVRLWLLQIRDNR